jgi:hypothetical protein
MGLGPCLQLGFAPPFLKSVLLEYERIVLVDPTALIGQLQVVALLQDDLEILAGANPRVGGRIPSQR